MSKLSLERLRTEGEEFNTEISREYYLALSGNKASAELQPIYAQHAEIMSKDALDLTIDAFKAAPEVSEERRAARHLVDWEVDAQASRELAALDEKQISWEAHAVVNLADGQQVPFE